MTVTARHLLTDPEPAPATKSRGPWLRLSAAMADHVANLTERDDLIVTCTPGAGRGSPGCFIPSIATIELDGAHLGVDPATCDPARPSDRDRYPALWGVLTHESAHATHSAWHTSTSAPTAHIEAALMLEESRIEAAHLVRRPADRRWLRASTSQLILADLSHTGTSPMPSVRMTPWDAAHAAALLLARVDAGILDPDEVTSLRTTIQDVLGPSRLAALTALWRIAHLTGDHDQQTMLDLGRRWCNIIGAKPDRPAPAADQTSTSESTGSGETTPPSPLATAISTTLEAVQTSDSPPIRVSQDKEKARREERAAHRKARETARRVFADHETHPDPGRTSGPTAITGSRPPSPAEQVAARRLARLLRAAAHRERATTQTTSPTPPGRLRMRDAITADAQRAAGAIPTAEPFTRTIRRRVPTPPLRLGIACDVSGSMRTLAAPVASAAWILARAASHVPDANSATVIFGSRVRPVTHPGHTTTRVKEFTARDKTEQFCDAIDALDAALDLTRPNAARLLIIVSDGRFTPIQRVNGQHRINRLTKTGCAILWLALDNRARPIAGAHAVVLDEPAEAAAIIGQAAARALDNG